MKRKTMRKASVVTVMVITVMASTVLGFASTDNPQTVPAHITVPVTTIDFTVTEKINMTGTSNSNTLTVDNLEVTNNNNIGVINIDSVAAIGSNSWTIVETTTDFAKMAKDAKKLSLTADGSHDMTANYTSAGTVDPGQTDITAFIGKTGIVSANVTDEKVADIVVTVSLV